MREEFKGMVSIVVTYIIWGTQSLYWRTFGSTDLSYIMAHRILWSALIAVVLLIALGRKEELIQSFLNKRQLVLSFIGAIAIGLNWFLNIYAAATKQLVEASIGQYITPIIVILIGVLIFKETIKLSQKIAIFFVVVAIGTYIFRIGRIPLIAIFLIITFVLYTYIKKVNPSKALTGIALESILLTPFVLSYLIFQKTQGIPFFFLEDTRTILLLISTGFFTLIPLLLFSYGVKRMDFSKLGFLQYTAPSISLLIGICIFKEPFDWTHLLVLLFIWISIVFVWILPFFLKRDHLGYDKSDVA
ncbi:MAG: EamA family transporter RarD [Sedimentibacter sp.]